MNNKIYLKNIKKKFKSKIALNGISISFSQKKINGLLGPNGSGKSNLIECLLFVFGKSASKMRFKKLA